MDYSYLSLETARMDDKEFAVFRDYLCKSSGILVPPDKAYLFEMRLVKVMADAGCENFGELYRYIVSGKDPQITQKIINAMVINETLWFRDSLPWRVLEEDLLPRYIAELRSSARNKVRFWFSAVSTGQEAYSTVMCVDNYLKRKLVRDIQLSDFEFVATDISSRVLDVAKRGRYDAISIRRGLDDAYREKYFTQDKSAWELDPRIRDAVRFSRFNLQHSFLPLGSFDVIFCRYALIYFGDELKREISGKLRRALNRDGVLFVGNSAMSDYFRDGYEHVHYKNLTYFKASN